MKTTINFKFKSTWIAFQKWFDKRTLGGIVISWNDQRQVIQNLFESSTTIHIDWNRLWKEHSNWFIAVKAKKGQVLWSEQKRQIETLLINYAAETNKQVWTVVYKNNKGTICTMQETMTYVAAEKLKRKMAGDGNGEGGYDNVSEAVVVNLNSLF